MKTNINIGLKIGDTITITKYPGSWASSLNPNYPGRIKYPYTCKITSFRVYDDYVAITDDHYGFELLSLIKQNCLDNISVRKIKLNKLND